MRRRGGEGRALVWFSQEYLYEGCTCPDNIGRFLSLAMIRLASAVCDRTYYFGGMYGCSG